MEQTKRPRTEVDKSIFKLILFYERIENSVELIVRLKNDGFNGAKFFRSVVEAYLSHDPKFMEWFNTKRKTPKNRIKKVQKLVEDGRRLEIDKPSIAQTELVLAGRSVVKKKSDLTNFLETTTVNQDLIPLISQFARQKAKSEHNQTIEKWESTQFKFLTAPKAFKELDLKLYARLLFGLTDIPVRDALLAHHIDIAQIKEDPNQYLFQIAQNWAQVAKVSPETFRPPICTCIAVFMWQAGEGILARSAVDFALAQDPQFHLAKLINNALDSGMPPWEFRDAFTKISNPWS